MGILDASFALIAPSTRAIGFIIPEVTLREVNRDDMLVTDHPVETGAAISDHAFMRPKEIELTVGWSECTGGTAYVALVYQAILALQASREPFTAFSGKRVYRSMVIAGIQKTADQHTDAILLLTVRLREVIITSTQTTSAPKAAQANPEKTASTAQVGQKQADIVQYAIERGM